MRARASVFGLGSGVRVIGLESGRHRLSFIAEATSSSSSPSPSLSSSTAAAGGAAAGGAAAGGAAAGGAAAGGGAFGGGAAGDDWAGAMRKASLAAAEGQRLALQQMVADVRDKGAAGAAPCGGAAPPESALQGGDRVSQPAPQSSSQSQSAPLDPGAASAAGPRSSAGTAAAAAPLFSKGQLEAWSSGSLPRGDNQVTRATAALGDVADAEPKEQWATLDGRVHSGPAPSVPPSAPGASAATAARAATAAKPAANPANTPATPVATPAAVPVGKPTRKPKLSLPMNPVKLRLKR